ncbi:MAG: spore germination protein GerW family protein [Candidatus Cloacimonadaceae bacterium]
MSFTKFFDKVKSSFNLLGGAKMAFGDPVQVGDMHVVPVARVQYGFGGGGAAVGKKKAETEEKPEDNESKKDPQDAFGGGGGAKVDPIGIFTLKSDKVSFFPILGVKELAALFSIIFLLLIRLGRKKKKKR